MKQIEFSKWEKRFWNLQNQPVTKIPIAGKWYHITWDTYKTKSLCLCINPVECNWDGKIKSIIKGQIHGVMGDDNGVYENEFINAEITWRFPIQYFCFIMLHKLLDPDGSDDRIDLYHNPKALLCFDIIVNTQFSRATNDEELLDKIKRDVSRSVNARANKGLYNHECHTSKEKRQTIKESLDWLINEYNEYVEDCQVNV